MDSTDQQQSKPEKRKFQFSLRSLLITVAAISILYACVMTFWKPIGVYVMRAVTARFYRSNFGNLEYRKYRESWHVDDWAVRFGGSSGLLTLKELASDQGLTTSGREEAARIATWISEAKHVSYLRMMDEGEAEPPGWPVSSLYKYIYLQDIHMEVSNSYKASPVNRK